MGADFVTLVTRLGNTAQTTSTVGVDRETGTFLLGPDEKDPVKAVFHDTAGQERYRAIATGFYRDSHGAMLVYDVGNRETFGELHVWLGELRQYAPEGCTLMLLGNKSDLPSNARTSVLTEEGLEFAEKHGMAFMEVSALSGVGVKEAFMALLNRCHEVKTQAAAAAGDGTARGSSGAAAPASVVTVSPKTPAPAPAGGCC